MRALKIFGTPQEDSDYEVVETLKLCVKKHSNV